jgi:uroporphyrin-III C-methyltransferase/precorrin-2 dehydrogenase/sirohydrochlorin ferrochelatase
VLLMAVERVGVFAAALVQNGRSADTPVAVVADGTLRTQQVVRCTLADVEEQVRVHGVRPPAIVVVGDVAGLARGTAEPTTTV